jgi:hypothetical protein
MASEFIERLGVKKSEAFRALSILVACCGVVGLAQAESTPPIAAQQLQPCRQADHRRGQGRRLLLMPTRFIRALSSIEAGCCAHFGAGHGRRHYSLMLEDAHANVFG